MFLLLHGWQNRRPPEHWQWWLARELRAAGEQVFYPQLPDPDTPSVEAWSDVVRAELAQMAGERVVLAHSLSTLLWLSLAPTLDVPVDRVLLVAPPSPQLLSGEPDVVEFTRFPVEPDRLGHSVRMVTSDDDPYCPEGAAEAFGAFGFDTDVLPGAAHLNVDAGYGPWPSVRDWCRDGSVRLQVR